MGQFTSADGRGQVPVRACWVARIPGGEKMASCLDRSEPVGTAIVAGGPIGRYNAAKDTPMKRIAAQLLYRPDRSELRLPSRGAVRLRGWTCFLGVDPAWCRRLDRIAEYF